MAWAWSHHNFKMETLGAGDSTTDLPVVGRQLSDNSNSNFRGVVFFLVFFVKPLITDRFKQKNNFYLLIQA